jgi:hypothetical protein
MSSILILHLSLEVLFWLRCGHFEILGLVMATITFAPPSFGDTLDFCFCFLFGWKEFVMRSNLISCLSMEVPFWLRWGRFEILGLVVTTYTFAPPSLGDTLNFWFCFHLNWKVFVMSSILIPHLSLEVLFWLRCGRFEILGLVMATITFAPPSLGDTLDFCFCFLFDWKEFVMRSNLIPCLSMEVPFWLRCGCFEILGLVVATVTFALPSLGGALVFCFCFLFLT